MSKQATRRPQPKRRPQQRKGRTAMAAKGGKGSNRSMWIMVSIVLVIGGVLLVAVASASNKKHAASIKDRQPAPASVVSKVTGISNDVINAVGSGDTVKNPITKVTPATAVLKTSDGKPRIVYMGAEYCPYCATERWAMVNALSRFGKFDKLKITTSAGAPELFPNTATFSFYGSTYDSPYIKFEPVEESTNTSKPLEAPTSEQADLLTKYDVAPKYTDRTGAIPFLDFANQYIISGASYDAGKLTGLEHQQIADDMADSSTAVSQGAVGTANYMTAAICKVTGDKPSNVCSQPAIQAIEKTL